MSIVGSTGGGLLGRVESGKWDWGEVKGGGALAIGVGGRTVRGFVEGWGVSGVRGWS